MAVQPTKRCERDRAVGLRCFLSDNARVTYLLAAHVTT
jgi:hypothetical protein